jgi:hypothetical protein
MNHSTKHAWRVAAALGGAAILVSWMCTGGCVQYQYWLNPVASHDRDFRPFVAAEVKSNSRASGVPLLYEWYSSRPPFGLRLTYITHTIVRDPMLTFDQLTIEFPDGTMTDLTHKFHRGVVPRLESHIYVEDHKRHETASLRWEELIEDCLPEASPFKVRIRAKLWSRDAIVEDFDAILNIHLKYESGSVTGWHWLAADSV